MRLALLRLFFAALVVLGLAFGQDLRIYFLNVGQGDAILVVSPDGKTLVYDAGRSASRAADLIMALGITRIDVAVSSQADADHIGGFEGIAQRLSPGVFVNNGLASTTQTYARVIQAMTTAGARGVRNSQEVPIALGAAVRVLVLPTPAGVPPADQNANSVGMLVEYAGFRAFFGGDAEPSTLRGWAAAYGPRLQNLDLYKAAHHGSRNNDTAEFLSLLRPRDVGIGVGANNQFGHPTVEALGLYQSVGAEVWRTDRDGTFLITVRADGTYTVQSETRRPVSRVAKGAATAAIPAPSPAPPSPAPAPARPNLVGLVTLQGRIYYVYDGRLPEPRVGAVNPTLASTIVLNGTILYVYDGQAP